MIRTRAPLAMASRASVSSVASLPCAFCTENWGDERPAAARASDRYGASNSVYRVEETVSGRIAATFPLPMAARGFSVVIAEKVLFRSATEIDGTAGELVLGGVVVELLLLLLLVWCEPVSATAIPRAAPTSTPTPATRATGRSSRRTGLGAGGSCTGGGT